jgi:hypothetical protein
MTITGYLIDYSLPELFQFLDKGEKTGFLSLDFSVDEKSNYQNQYIWFRYGRIVASSDNIEGKGLINIIQQKGWFNKKIEHYYEQRFQNDAPLGLSLKSYSLLDAEQLKMLFYAQVMRKVCDLFQCPNGWFEFTESNNLAFAEMTGLSSPGTDLTLAGLRALRDWTALQPKLPQGNSTLINVCEGEPKVSINKAEKDIWQLSNGKKTVSEIAKNLDLSLDKTKETAFRLIATGLVEEVPMVTMIKEEIKSTSLAEESNEEKSGLSSDFLSSLMGFLTEV